MAVEAPPLRFSINLIRESELRSLVKLSHTSIFTLVKRGLFPKPVRIGVRAVAWKEADIVAWLTEREAKR